ncbi:hypothetical protein [Flavobacterium reichenbachii]|uniref:Uncharacterized protein n=1 Tax=Flavobacterium reichenbachii TaxID=362418 RepID=A0A085ZNV1_9FLAO|nr:hypothetical protein [Flavobacterium reichenbachii]KFF06115.1 hypothetical protein IW19_11505 [Flavobacterium reichenbachii]OXB14662.1 hypothetical protein B0A68_11445 [Flavobacterium reichenbachii]
MKNILQIIGVICLIGNIMISVLVTSLDVYSNRYFREYENIKSFKNTKSNMTTDFLVIERAYQDTGPENGIGTFVIEGELSSNHSKIRLSVGKQEYLGSNLNEHALYKSKLTNDYFLKDAPQEYYNYELCSFYMGIYFKVSFYIIIAILLYFLINYIKARRYRLY